MDPSEDNGPDETINPQPQDNDTPYSPPDDVPAGNDEDSEDEALKPALENDQEGNEQETDQQELYDQGQENQQPSNEGVEGYNPESSSEGEDEEEDEEEANPPA